MWACERGKLLYKCGSSRGVYACVCSLLCLGALPQGAKGRPGGCCLYGCIKYADLSHDVHT